MKKIESPRPKTIYSDNLWNLYLFFNSLDYPNIFIKDKLYLITGISIGGEDTEYGHYSIGDLPCRKNEWLWLNLLDICSGHYSKTTFTIEYDVLYERKMTIEELLAEYEIRIPDKEELQNFLDFEL